MAVVHSDYAPKRYLKAIKEITRLLKREKEEIINQRRQQPRRPSSCVALKTRERVCCCPNCNYKLMRLSSLVARPLIAESWRPAAGGASASQTTAAGW